MPIALHIGLTSSIRKGSINVLDKFFIVSGFCAPFYIHAIAVVFYFQSRLHFNALVRSYSQMSTPINDVVITLISLSRAIRLPLPPMFLPQLYFDTIVIVLRKRRFATVMQSFLPE